VLRIRFCGAALKNPRAIDVNQTGKEGDAFIVDLRLGIKSSVNVKVLFLFPVWFTTIKSGIVTELPCLHGLVVRIRYISN
jgi:hypothetical protein